MFRLQLGKIRPDRIVQPAEVWRSLRTCRRRPQARDSLDHHGGSRLVPPTGVGRARPGFSYRSPAVASRLEDSFGSTWPRFLTILNFPFWAWAMYMFIRT
jgi:hypothetical protein